MEGWLCSWLWYKVRFESIPAYKHILYGPIPHISLWIRPLGVRTGLADSPFQNGGHHQTPHAPKEESCHQEHLKHINTLISASIYRNEACFECRRCKNISLFQFSQGVTKRYCLSWLTNSTLLYENKCGGRGDLRVLRQWVQLYKGAQITFRDLIPYLTWLMHLC